MVPESGLSKLELMQGRVRFVPDGWKYIHTSKAFKIRNNLRLPISEEERSKNQGHYPYYGPTKIQGYIGDYQQDGEFALIGEDGDHFLKYRSNIMTQLVNGKCTVNNHAHIIEGTKIASREWFYYYFMHRDIFSFLTRQGAGRYKLNKAALEQLPILIPPLPEQKKITKTLSTWDRAIEVTEHLISNSQQQKKAIIQQLLTGKKRFQGFKKSEGFTKTRYGLIPSDWDFVSIESVADQFTKKNSDEIDYPVLSCSKYVGFVDSLKYFKKKVYSDNTSGYKIIKRGYFGFPSNHIEEGSIGYQNLYETGLVSPIYTVFKANKKLVNDTFLYKLLKTEHYRQIFAAATNASVDRRGSLRWKEFSKIRIMLPSLEEQQKIASVLPKADREIEILQQKLDCFKQEKKALMQQLFTGKCRVKIDKEAV